MRSPWIYRAGALALLFAGGLAIFIDASYSYDWIAKNIGTSQSVSQALSFILATLASSFGGLITNPESWKLVFSNTKELATIDSPNERLLTLVGYGMTVTFLVLIFTSVYMLNLVSNYAKTNSWFAAILICFSSDACLMLAMPLWFLSKASKKKSDELESRLGDSSYGETKTVNANSRRFN